MDVRIREQRLPGIGHRYDLPLDRDRHLMIVVERTGNCHVGVITGDAEKPDSVVSLSRDLAVAVAALLTGARFSIDSTADDRFDADEITVETVALGPRSPAIGRVVEEVPLPEGGGTSILAVIRDEPADLVEGEPVDPLRPGDRIVVSGPRERLADVTQRLAG